VNYHHLICFPKSLIVILSQYHSFLKIFLVCTAVSEAMNCAQVCPAADHFQTEPDFVP